MAEEPQGPPNLEIYGDDPGAVRHGNFINYYRFHSAEQRLNTIPARDIQEHIQNIPDSSNDHLFALDLGCNTGEITQGIHAMLKSFNPDTRTVVLGIDIDPQLIRRAQENNPHPTDVHFEAGNLMHILTNEEYLFKLTNGRRRFHLVSCLSLTMWIHLNNGDVGLQNFLRRIAAIADILIVEPQRWKNYKDAVRRMKRGGGVEDAFPYFAQLTWKETVEQNIREFLESKECEMRLIYESKPSSWGRIMSVYVRRDESTE